MFIFGYWGFWPKENAWSFSSCILMWTSNMCRFFTSLKRVTLQPRSRWLFWFHRGDLKCRASGVSTKEFPARLEIPKSSKTQLGMYIFMYIYLIVCINNTSLIEVYDGICIPGTCECPVFWCFNPPKESLLDTNRGHLGSRYLLIFTYQKNNPRLFLLVDYT